VRPKNEGSTWRAAALDNARNAVGVVPSHVLDSVARRSDGTYRGAYEKKNGRFRAVATSTPGQAVQDGTWATAREAAIPVDRATLYFGRDDLRLNLPRPSR